MSGDRLLPEGANVAYAFYHFMPYDPGECDPDMLKKGVHRLKGDLQGVVIPRAEVQTMAKLFKCTPETILRYSRQTIRKRLCEAMGDEDGGVESLYPVPEEYLGEIDGAAMTKADIQEEIDALRRRHGFDMLIEVKLLEQSDEAAGSTIVLGMPFANRPHRVMVFFPLETLRRAKPSIRLVIRHEFAHCLAETRAWKEKYLVSIDHDGDEWFRACEEVGISPDSFGSPHEDGYYSCQCPECGFEGYQLHFEGEEPYERCCPECDAVLKQELMEGDVLYFARNQVLIVTEDGRTVPSALSADDFIGLVPECFDD